MVTSISAIAHYILLIKPFKVGIMLYLVVPFKV